ncbi:MAG: hypothetical protein IJY36_01080 [Coprobacter sp.]|nr:hypothetical protein [Coprobacter sp.]
MIKTYKTSHGNLSTIVNMNGKNVRIRFVSRDNNTGYYTTPNVALQTAIESDRDYDGCSTSITRPNLLRNPT